MCQKAQLNVCLERVHRPWRKGCSQTMSNPALHCYIAIVIRFTVYWDARSSHRLHNILSRTRRWSGIVIVGNEADTLRIMKETLLRRTQFEDFMEHVMSVLTGQRNSNAYEAPTLEIVQTNRCASSHRTFGVLIYLDEW